jgi:hypothetical protein
MPKHYLKFKKGSKEYKKAYKDHLKKTADRQLSTEDQNYKNPKALTESMKKGAKYGAFAGAVGGSAYAYGKHKGRGSTTVGRSWDKGGPFKKEHEKQYEGDHFATVQKRDKGVSKGAGAITGGVSGAIGSYAGMLAGAGVKKIKDKYKQHKRVKKLRKSGYGVAMEPFRKQDY